MYSVDFDYFILIYLFLVILITLPFATPSHLLHTLSFATSFRYSTVVARGTPRRRAALGVGVAQELQMSCEGGLERMLRMT